nr:PASTA domain-containing protein [Micromonospora sp. DSM 115978]
MKYGLTALGVVVVFVVVALLATQLFSLGGGGGDEDGGGTTAAIPAGLIGKQVGVVQNQLEREGFTNIQAPIQVPDPSREPNSVTEIDPPEGTEIEKSAPITLTVAVAPDAVPIP